MLYDVSGLFVLFLSLRYAVLNMPLLSRCLSVLCASSPLALGLIQPGDLENMGFGDVSGQISFGSNLPTSEASRLLSYVVIANIAQSVLPFVYFSLNGLLTSMLAGREWSQFTIKRKGLRVSCVPTGSQRSNYFLQLPYRFVIPIMIISATLQWLVSESISVVAVEPYDFDGHLMTAWELDAISYSGPYLALAYSHLAILLIFMMLAVLMIIVPVLGRRLSFPPGLPLAGSCSAVIAAACHVDRVKGGDDMALKPLQWGVVSSMNGVYHCAFSSKEVDSPNEYDLYT